MHDDADHYQFEAAMSGCMFDSCSKSQVRFYRHAAFSAEAGSEDSLVERKKVVRCFSETYDKDWKCLPSSEIIAKMVGLEETAIELSPDIGDELAIALVKFMRSQCFVAQLNDYEEELGAKVPEWAHGNFRISALALKKEKFYVSVPFSIMIAGYYVLEAADETSSCGFSLVEFGKILY